MPEAPTVVAIGLLQGAFKRFGIHRERCKKKRPSRPLIRVITFAFIVAYRLGSRLRIVMAIAIARLNRIDPDTPS
jgi:hypothetical protein